MKRTETSNFGREAQELLWATHLHVRAAAAPAPLVQAAASEHSRLIPQPALLHDCCIRLAAARATWRLPVASCQSSRLTPAAVLDDVIRRSVDDALVRDVRQRVRAAT
jgi:hypothetical protein